MLILSRKKNESVIINGTYIVKVLDVRGDKVRIGFENFPADMSIHREEVELAVQREKETAKCEEAKQNLTTQAVLPGSDTVPETSQQSPG